MIVNIVNGTSMPWNSTGCGYYLVEVILELRGIPGGDFGVLVLEGVHRGLLIGDSVSLRGFFAGLSRPPARFRLMLCLMEEKLLIIHN